MAGRRDLVFDALTAFVGRVVNWWLAMRGKNAMHRCRPGSFVPATIR